MQERGPRDTGGEGGGAPEASAGPESGAERDTAGAGDETEETRDETSGEGAEEARAEERPEAPAEEAPETAREATPEEETGERIDWLEKVAGETKEREEAFYKEKYGEGRWSNFKKWLNETDAGKAVKIGTKVILGTAAAVTATALTGGTGLLLAPALYGLGIKSAVDGGIEAASYLAKGRGMRIAIEGARQDMKQSREERFGELKRMREAGEIDEATFAEKLVTLTKEIANKEKEIIQKETERMKWEKKEATVRAIASTVASIGVMAFTGVPLGVQNFDADKASHAVRFTWRGFEFIYHAGEKMAQTVHGLAFGLKTHALGHLPPMSAFVGLGGAAVGMFATTAAGLRGAKERGEIPYEDPKYIRLAEEYKGRVRPTGPAPSEAYVPGVTPEEGAPPEEEGAPEETTAEEGATPEGAPARPTEGAEEEGGPERETLTRLQEIHENISRLVVESRYSLAGLTDEERQARREEIADEIERLNVEKNKLVDELGLRGTAEYLHWNDALFRHAKFLVPVLEAKEDLTESQRADLDKNKKYLEEHETEHEEAEASLFELLKKKRAEGPAPTGEAGGGEV